MAERLRGYVVGIMRDVLSKKDPAEAAIIDEAEVLHAHKEAVLAPDLTRQMRHPDNIIPPAEVIPALLSEDNKSLTTIVKTMEQEQSLRDALLSARTGSLDAVRKARAAGHEIPGIDEKLKILGIAP
jgi:hypothetical protein